MIQPPITRKCMFPKSKTLANKVEIKGDIKNVN